mmetsp:Transcript_35717/g.58791  ORF Transcript_35717/g.58791 Transcript_35717/m.58791 type:complete len:282 (+) Transcript_35717:54-899(+)
MRTSVSAASSYLEKVMDGDENTDVPSKRQRVQPPQEPARLLVLGALLPGQRLLCKAPPPEFHRLLESSKEPLVVVGRNRFFLLVRGAEVTGRRDGDDVVLEATGRVAELADVLEAGKDDESRWAGRIGNVQWLGRLEDDDYALSCDDSYHQAKANDHAGYVGLEENPERLTRLNETLGELIKEWISLVHASNCEKWPGQINSIIQSLGPLPTKFNARAMYTAALINPLPSLGIAMDIRPAVITARGTSRRLSLAEEGLRDSIQKIKKLKTTSDDAAKVDDA